jgi:D-alanyl-D-alanine carboxypeptidase
MRKNFTLVFLLLSLTLQAQDAVNTSLLDSLFHALSVRNLAQGSICVTQNGKIVYRKAVGNAFINGEEKILADINTRYRVGSVTKLFTAVMLFQLLEEGKIKLDGTLGQYYPALPNASKITIRQMLYHRSGLHDYTIDTNFPDWMDQRRTHDDLLKIITEKGPDFEPDAKASYCNTNYLLLGYIIEKLDKSTYEAILRKRIISKIGLRNTYFGHAINMKTTYSHILDISAIQNAKAAHSM